MTENRTNNQSVLYYDYFEAVKAFNLTNAQYLTTVDDIATQRQDAIQHAIAIYINPMLSTLRSVQIVSIAVGVLSFAFMCGRIYAGSGALLTLIAFVLGIIALAVFLWALSKVRELRESMNFVIQQRLPDIPS